MTFLTNLLRWLRLIVARLLPYQLRWRLLARPYRRPYRRLRASLASPYEVQLRSLRRIIEANRETEFGRAHAFDQITDPATYAAKVPLRGYPELEPYIQRHLGGASDVLVASSLIGYAISGGSRGCPKPIPVTRASLGQRIWADEMLERLAIQQQSMVAQGVCLHLLPGYQETTSRTTMPMVPLAVLSSAAGRDDPRRIPPALPHQLFSIEDETVRYYLALRIAISQPVTMLRAASPGTLTILAEHLELLGSRLLDDLAVGRIDPEAELPESVRRVLPVCPPDPALAARLREKAEKRGRLEPREIWPHLELLVCSTSGHSKAAADRLADRFGGLMIIDPGYRAAEGVFTWPWVEGAGGLPVTEGQFLEFLPADEQRDASVLATELQVGQRYRPVVTGSNGLYRYVMDDVLEVLHQTEQGPRLSLVGRSTLRLRLPAGTLEEGAFREALTDAARGCDVVLAGYTGWLGQPPSPPTQAEQDRPGWWSRLLRRVQEPGTSTHSALTIAVEPTGDPLAADRAKKLLVALDSALREHCANYDRLRGEKALGKPGLLLLKQGTFRRRRRQRLADGAAGAHGPLPVLTEDGWLVDAEDLEMQV